MPEFHRGSWIVYFNGIEVPATQVQVSYGVMQPPEADIQMPPDRELLRLGSEDRVQVTVFYLDTIQTANEGKKPEYRLLFEGEISGWAYSNTPMGRSLGFRAVSHTAVLQQLFTFFMTNVDGIAAGRFGGGDQFNTAVFGPLFPTALFYQGLKSGDQQDRTPIRRPFDLMENLLRSLFGEIEFNKFNSSVAAHFFARWARLTNFINRWAPSPYLEGEDLGVSPDGVFPILRALRQQEAVSSLVQEAQEMANSMSLWDMMVDIFQRVYYEFTLLPTAPLVSYDLESGRILGPPEYAGNPSDVEAAKEALLTAREKLAGARTLSAPGDALKARVAEAEAVVSAAEDGLARAEAAAANSSRGRGPADPKRPLRLLNYVTKPQLQYCVPPRCNIIFPSMLTMYQFQEAYQQQPTRIYINDDQRYRAVQGQSGVTQVNQALTSIGYPERVQKAMYGANENLVISGKNFLLYPEEFYRGPVVMRSTTPRWFFRLKDAMAREQFKTQVDYDTYYQRVQQIEQLYAQYEYVKARSAAKTGGATLRFNPYLAPGFPTVIFDRKETNVHVFAYLVSVQHSLGTNGMSTTIGYSHAQTFEEFFQGYISEKNELNKTSEKSALQTKAEEDLTQAEAELAALQQEGGPRIADRIAAAVQAVAQKREALVQASVRPTSSGLEASLHQAQAELSAAQAALAALGQTPDVQRLSEAQAKVENAQDAVRAAEAAALSPDMSPSHPVSDIRSRFQNIAKAQEYYTALFQQGQTYAQRPSAFDWRAAIGVMDPDSPNVPAEPITISEGQVRNVVVDGRPASRKEVTTNALRNTSAAGYWLRDNYVTYANDSDAAMRYVARPICSLDEYIDFHGDRGVRDEKVELSPAGAYYYVRILDLVQGPGIEPVEDEYGNRLSPVLEDTRRDWESRLLNYRAKARAAVNYKA